MLYWLLFVSSMFVGISVLIGWFVQIVEKAWPKTKIGWFQAGTATLVSFMFVGGTLSSPLWWEFPALGNVVLSIKEDGTVTTSEFFGVPDWGNRKVFNVSPDRYSAQVIVQPITANPKVRHLVSVVTARVSDPTKYVVSDVGKRWSEGSFTRQIESALYEFHEKHSVELGKFYNPHTQRAEYYELVTDALGPDLAKKGIEITDARFTM